MIIGLLSIILFLPSSRSLKDKRRLIKGMIEKIKNRYNVSISELDHHDLWQKSKICIAYIAKNQPGIEKTFQKIEGFIESNPEIIIAQKEIDLFKPEK